jgi:predicted phage baseplate assembly protein
VKADREGTRVALQASTRYVYDRRSLRVNANVVAATCGESVDEIVGSGAADQPDQRFALRQGPLTYVSAQTPDGRASTLTLRVNDLAWQEVPHLYQRGSNERVFTTQADDSGRTTVVFGDGIEGARPPSGRDNIRAHYRKGLGTSGNVKTGQLANLLNRPLGVAGVSNPEPASGGQDAQLTDAARDSAPLTVLTLERAVSVLDYQNFSRSFAGIAKAHAVWIAAGAGRGVFITVAAEQGAALDENDATYVDLLGALRRYGDALLNLRVASYRPALFGLRVALKLAGDADRAVALAGAERALRDAFSFEQRSFGQIVSIDEVAAILHTDPSVIGVNVIALYRSDQGAPSLAPRLFARLPETSLTALPEPAELLALDASRLTLEIMQ